MRCNPLIRREVGVLSARSIPEGVAGGLVAERGSAGDALAERVGAEGDTTLAIFKLLPYIHRQFNPYLFCSLYLNPP